MRYSGSLYATLVLFLAFSFSDAFVPQTRTNAKDALRPALPRPNAKVSFPISSCVSEAKHQTAVSMASEAETEDSPSWRFDPLFGALWIGFNMFAFLGPGFIGDPQDFEMIKSYIDNPADPGFSEAFQLIFNYLGVMPIIIACLAVPQAAQRGLPPLPFLVSSFGLGFGGAGKTVVLIECLIPAKFQSYT